VLAAFESAVNARHLSLADAQRLVAAAQQSFFLGQCRADAMGGTP